MNKYVTKIALSLLLIFGIFAAGTPSVQAESTPLSVKAILPDNQYDKEVSYYSLLMKPGQTQEIEVQLFNSSDKDTTAILTLTSATTNDNGLIDYNLPDKEVDKSLLYPFTSIATAPKEVVIPAGKDVKAKIKLEMPVEEYDGMILGGINIKAKKDATADEKESQSGGMKIENELNYAIGVVLIENEEPVVTNMLLDRVFASQIMGVNTIKATLRNPTSAVMENTEIEAKIYKKDSNQVLYEIKREGYRMAPNSNFDFGIPLGKERYQAGDYHLKIVATSDPQKPEDGEKQTWEMEKDFTINREEADQLNETAVDLPPDYTLYYIIGGVVLLLLLIAVVSFCVLRKKKKEAKKKAMRQARERQARERQAKKRDSNRQKRV